MSIFLYGRVSHQLSADSGLSIEDQVETGLKYVQSVIPQEKFSGESYGIQKRGVFVDDGVSGWSKNFCRRPAGHKVSTLVGPGDHIVCYSIDRLARNLRDFCNTTHRWSEGGVHIHYIQEHINTQTAFGKWQAHMRAAAAQFYSDLISERTREALAIKRLQAGQEVVKSKERRLWLPSEFTRSPAKEGSDTVSRGGTVHMYERVSTNRQYTSGLGLGGQTRCNMQYALQLAINIEGRVGEVFSDPAVSAYKIPFAERKAGGKLLTTVQPGDHIVVYKLDRAWRNPADALSMCDELEKKGVYVHMVTEGLRTDTKEGAEWIAVLASMAHMESRLRSFRVRAALEKCRAEGRPAGPLQRGFKATKVNGKHKMTLDRKASLQLAVAWLLRNEYGMQYKQIEDAVTAWRCAGKGKVTLKDYKRLQIQKNIKSAEDIRQMSSSFWESLLPEDRAQIEQPMPKNLWVLPRWEWPWGLV